MEHRKVTIVDVARHAQVSLGTASKALNYPDQVGPKRLARVLQAIDELGYTRNMLAQGLRAKRTSVVGLCMPHSRVSFFSALMYRFEELAFAEGLQTMFVLSHEASERELSRVKTLVSYGVIGVLLVPSRRPQVALDFLHANEVPTVVVDRPLDDLRFDQVVADNQGAAEALAMKLIGIGHDRILLIARRRTATATVHRVAGLRRAKRATGGRLQIRLIEAGDDECVFRARLSATLSEFAPTAVIVSNDVIAAWTMRLLQLLKIRCPADVSLVTFDEPSWAEVVKPSLSTVRLAVDEMANTAWKLLANRMQDPGRPPQVLVTPAEVQYRGSVARPPRSARLRRDHPE